MTHFVIDGGHRLRGDVVPSGNKNEVLPCLAATLLTEEPVILSNVPRIADVEVMLQILEMKNCEKLHRRSLDRLTSLNAEWMKQIDDE